MILRVKITRFKEHFDFRIPGAGGGAIHKDIEGLLPLIEEAFDGMVWGFFGKRVSSSATFDKKNREAIVRCNDISAVVALQVMQLLFQGGGIRQADALRRLGWSSKAQLKTVTKTKNEPSLSKLQKIADSVDCDLELSFVPRPDSKNKKQTKQRSSSAA